MGQGPGYAEGRYINWLAIKDQAESVLGDAKRMRGQVLVEKNVPICEFVYDVKSGKLIEVPEAMTAGRAL